ncbi:hypothetical protein MKZ20_17610 [Psychrobacillus sp. FSL K6-2684]|uniref:hypothetical protein n=1 Tax=Psychrobacillus sp. FSL K6-2684 TaxID=2921547 RepID=UPI0030FADBF5
MRTIQSELSDKGFTKLSKDNRPTIKKKITEKLSRRDLKDLMGCNRGIYARGKGGAFRQR